MTVNIQKLDDKLRIAQEANSALQTQEYMINMGPQHPIAHGSLRLVLRMDGETVKEVIPVPGYIHRGVEKIGEHMTMWQFTHLTDRTDYLSSLMNNWAVAKLVEKYAGIEVSERVQYIRTIMAELMRIQSHVLWWGVLGMDLGAFTAFLYGFRERELIAKILEETIGARLTMNYIIPGGLARDLHPDFVPKVKALLPYLRKMVDEYDTLLSNNIILQERLRNIGILSAEDAISLGCTGPVLRGSGVPYDLRKVEPYGAYDKVEFNVPVGTIGDNWDRYYVRIEEIRESIKIIEQLIDNLPDGDVLAVKFGKKIKIPKGTHYEQIETARGVMGVFVVGEGKGDIPYRIHVRSPNFNNLWAVTKLAPGWRIADIIAIQSTLDLVIPDIDR